MPKRRIAVLTTGRQDFGILRSTISALIADERFEVMLWVGGMHLAQRFGHTIDHVAAAGFAVHERVPFISEPPHAVSDTAKAFEVISATLQRHQPDALMLVGDRSETFAAGFAATMLGVPLIHLHGGEETEGAVDNALRHGLTKLSHVHLVSHEVYAKRVRQMGEPDDTVHLVGAPGLDTLYRDDLPTRAEVEAFVSMKLVDPVVLTTLHSSTLGAGDPMAEAKAMTAAMSEVPDATFLITAPNADAGGDQIRAHLEAWVATHPRARLVSALGELRYFSVLRLAACVLGNSSSGLIEAPALGLPVVNIGDRQKGRLRTPHIIDVAARREDIVHALKRALDPATKAALPVPTLKGPAAPRIVAALSTADFTRPARKRFVDRP